MEALAALSLAGTVVQTVELAAKLLSASRNAYESGVGTTVEVEALCGRMQNLQVLTARASQPAGTAATGTHDKIELDRLSEKVKRLAQEVVALSNRLKAKNPKSRAQIVYISLRAHFKEKSHMERLEKEIVECHNDIRDRVALMMR